MLRKLAPEFGRFVSATVRFRAEPLSAARRYWKLYRQRRFSPDEIHFLNLLEPDLSDDDLRSYVSKEELLALQSRLNGQGQHALTEDKVRFYLHCLDAGLPTPAIYALYDRRGGGADSAGGIPDVSDEEGMRRFLSATPADTFILKPVGGVHGEGVQRFHRDGSEWVNKQGTIHGHREILDSLRRSPYSRWMLQQVLVGHSDLCELSGTDALQTIRVVTALDATGQVRILAARLRLICGDGIHDNFDYGRTGNLIANLDVGPGAIRSIVGGAPDRHSIRHVERHPRTGKLLPGYQVPHWPQAKSLAERAAKAFMPLRTIGWDVAVCQDSVALIEANVTWDTLSGEPRMGEIFRYLETLVEPAPARD